MLPEVVLQSIEQEFSVAAWENCPGSTREELYENCMRIADEMTGSLLPVVRARQLEWVLRHAPICVNPQSRFADRIRHEDVLFAVREPSKQQTLAAQPIDCHAEYLRGFASGLLSGDEDFGHTTPDWTQVLRLGIPGLRQRSLDAMQHKRDAGQLSARQEAVYTASVIALNAMAELALRFAEEADRLDTAVSREAAQTLRALTEHAPQTLAEALQLILLYYFVQAYVEGSIIRSLGPLDQLLEPFCAADLAAGRCDEAQVQTLLAHFLYRLHAANITANVPFLIGGTDAEGNCAVNAMSYRLIDTYVALRPANVKIHVRCADHIPDAFWRAVLCAIRKGCNSFVFCNDNVVIAGLQRVGISLADARRYVMIGCYEPAAMGTEIPCTCNGRVNFAKAVELALNNGRDLRTNQPIGPAVGEADTLDTFDALIAAVKAQIAYAADLSMRQITELERRYPTIHAAPLHTAAIDACIESGKDVYEGGAKYNNSSVVGFAMATAVDSLSIIRQLVYEQKRFTLPQFAQILRENWAGQEPLRLECGRNTQKFGNHLPEVDAVAADLLQFLDGCITGKPNGRGGVFRLGCFSVDWRFFFGERVAATADGRFAGEPLSKNLSPNVAQDRNGVTALLQSVSAMPLSLLSDGAVVDLMLHPTTVSGEEGIAIMQALLKSHFACGGYAVHINIFDAETLKKAQRDPERYATLQVRLCGWNAYFVRLSREEQDHLIRQAENRTA